MTIEVCAACTFDQSTHPCKGEDMPHIYIHIQTLVITHIFVTILSSVFQNPWESHSNSHPYRKFLRHCNNLTRGNSIFYGIDHTIYYTCTQIGLMHEQAITITKSVLLYIQSLIIIIILQESKIIHSDTMYVHVYTIIDNYATLWLAYTCLSKIYRNIFWQTLFISYDVRINSH